MSRIPFVFKLGADDKPTSVTVFVDGKSFPIQSSAEHFGQIFEALQKGDEAKVRALVNVKKSIAEFSGGLFKLTDTGLFYKGAEIDNVIVKRILAFFKLGVPVVHMVAFLENLLQNPSQVAINELYLFLEQNDLPITEDGHFLAYKMISKEYKDKYTGKMDNSVGKQVTMDRAAVDSNRHNTCSHGLHFASREYVEKGSYGSIGNGDRLVVLKINPKDVVSIPSDYNNSKGRAWTYLVFEEIEWSEKIASHFRPTDGTVFVADNDLDTEEESEFEDEFEEGEEPEEEEEAEEVSTGGLTDDDVRSIRKLLKADNMSLTAIGKMYGVHRTTIQRIRDRISHTSVK